MALPPDYEHIRASLLHRHPLPTVGQALAELRSEETRKKTMVYQHSQPVLATPVWAPPPPPSSPPVRVPSSKNIPSGSQKKYCSFCRRDTHSYEDCRSRPRSKHNKGYHNRQIAAVTDSSGPSSDSSSSTLTAADVETRVTQVLSRTNIHSSALSTTSGSPPSPSPPSPILPVPDASPSAAPPSVSCPPVRCSTRYKEPVPLPYMHPLSRQKPNIESFNYASGTAGILLNTGRTIGLQTQGIHVVILEVMGLEIACQEQCLVKIGALAYFGTQYTLPRHYTCRLQGIVSMGAAFALQ
ncbi:hypothetical protein Acr_00g0065110 [Actinidia rufa]|uniref:Uncharacterized protein n=1 Tax=Actinidia rufa TaxID=165716 RepID=A0A7J0DPQ7_9ERIC|nr:hypothetical protein Acr_00g0065110 [Actinidia rufa]